MSNKIKTLTIKNFKAYGSNGATFEFSDLNLIFGRNSAGKSTALQALKYFASVLRGKDLSVKKFNSLINYEQDYKHPVIRIELEEFSFKEIEGDSRFPITLLGRSPFIEIEIDRLFDQIVIWRYETGYDNKTLIKLEYHHDDRDEGNSLVSGDLDYLNNIYTDKYNADEIIERFLKYRKKEKTTSLKIKKPDSLSVFFNPSEEETVKNIVDQCGIIEHLSDAVLLLSYYFENDKIYWDDEEDVAKRNPKLNSISSNPRFIDLYKIDPILPHDRAVFDFTIPRRHMFKSYPNELDKIDKEKLFSDPVESVRYLFSRPISILLELASNLPNYITSNTIHVGPLRSQLSHINDYDPADTCWYDGSAAYHELLDNNKYNINEINGKISSISEKNSYSIYVNCYSLNQETAGKDSDSHLPKEIKTLSLKTKKGHILDFSDVGTGISQCIPIIVALENNSKLILIEQPELHLHPSVTLNLADFMVDSIRNNNQIFIETHSEHIILRVLRHIREKRMLKNGRQLNPNDVSVIYVDYTRGQLSPVRIAIDEDGEFITKWPHGFFAERAREIF